MLLSALVSLYKRTVRFAVKAHQASCMGLLLIWNIFAGRMFWRMQGCQRRAAAMVPCQACPHLLWKKQRAQCGRLRLSGTSRLRYACSFFLGPPAHPKVSDTAAQGYPCHAQM